MTVAASVASFGGNNKFCAEKPVKLTCNVQGNPIPYVELVNNTNGRVLLSASSSSVTYSISQVDKRHIGNYSCLANNTIGPKVSKGFSIDHVFGRYNSVYCRFNAAWKLIPVIFV